jgi:integrase
VPRPWRWLLKISTVTNRKEIASFRAAWNWGLPMNLTRGIFPNRGLRYPKADEKPPFMTWAEVKRAIAHGGTASDLCDCLYLLPDELAELLQYVKETVLRGWHTLRHSFISACASKGVDQRLIDECSGHSTEEQRKRYRHLFAEVQQNARNTAFS